MKWRVNEGKHMYYWNIAVTIFDSVSIFIWKDKLLFAQYSQSTEHSGVWLGLLGTAVISNELVKEIMSNVEAHIFNTK